MGASALMTYTVPHRSTFSVSVDDHLEEHIDSAEETLISSNFWLNRAKRIQNLNSTCCPCSMYLSKVLLDNFLPVLDVKDLLSLGRTSKAFQAIITDDTFWKLKCDRDFKLQRKEDCEDKPVGESSTKD